MENKLIINCDGGSRGNPGPAAIGAVVGLKEYAEKIGRTTNNVAEWTSLVFAMKKAKQILGKAKAKETVLEIRMDSELVIKQVNGEYKIMNSDLQPLFIDVWNLKQDFKKVEFRHVPREENKRADYLVNLALDSK
ncbi:MAG TPA: ribonuclease HI family protein [Candidatus Colwellbacteria bacterium]|nr:ribonuclease HI family protein [Candidatus Colwellbacteria bacterium]HQA96030.1 ribonuclease HI family protein [Candidatus Colwellbacteria bacterium]